MPPAPSWSKFASSALTDGVVKIFCLTPLILEGMSLCSWRVLCAPCISIPSFCRAFISSSFKGTPFLNFAIAWPMLTSRALSTALTASSIWGTSKPFASWLWTSAIASKSSRPVLRTLLGVDANCAILKASCSGVRDAIRSASRRASSCLPSLCLTCSSRIAARGSSPNKVPLSACASLYACAASNWPCSASARAATAFGSAGLIPSRIILSLVPCFASNSAPVEVPSKAGYFTPERAALCFLLKSAACCLRSISALYCSILETPMFLASSSCSGVRERTSEGISETFSGGYPNCA